MSFDTKTGTRGARQPGGPVLRWVNAFVARRIRRRGQFNGFDALILRTVGRKSGVERATPVGWFPGPDGSWLIVASAAGAAANPAWYHNLAANPDKVRIDLKGETIPVHAEQLHGPDREEAWTRIAKASPRFADYQTKTDRELPVIRLTRR
jgi:deazaflavin-dependent oxidoreductase (nitroreductase family)